ncbi:MAG TPA: cation diffusion facilitator family transporter [Candidatus Thermoplasmatota archaeon]|nr:cation diffusion facilitator family transporter [Candidatus Thermoplasmatota archaeon]
MSAGGSKIAVFAALVGNLLIAALKLVAGLISQSAAMLAEAAHSFSDVGNQVLLLIGLKRANRPPSARHPYGTGKDAYFWPFMVSILLFGVAGAYSVFEGIEKIAHADEHELGDVRLSLAILALSFVIEAVSITFGVREAKKSANASGVATLREFLAENRDASLLTVLVEDGLALIALPIAAAAIIATELTHNALWDGLGSLGIGLILMGFAVFLASTVHALLVGTGLSKRDLAKVHGVLAQEPAIERILSMQSMYLGPHAVLIGIEMDIRDDIPASDVEKLVVDVEKRLVDALPVLRYVYLVPRNSSKVL